MDDCGCAVVVVVDVVDGLGVVDVVDGLVVVDVDEVLSEVVGYMAVDVDSFSVDVNASLTVVFSLEVFSDVSVVVAKDNGVINKYIDKKIYNCCCIMLAKIY